MTQRSRRASPDTPPPPFPMVFANGHALNKSGAPVPRGAVLRGRIDDYITESSAAIEDNGSFSFLKVTPSDHKYVGRPLVFRLEIAGVGIVESQEQLAYEPRKTEFGTRLTFDVPAGEPVPDPGPGPGPQPEPEPPPLPMVFAEGFALDRQGSPAPGGSILRGQIEDYTTESSATIESEGYFDFIKITPPSNSYAGKMLTFRLDEVPGAGSVTADQTFTYEPERTEFGTELTFNLPAPPPPDTQPGGGLLRRIINAILRLLGIRS